MLDIDLNEPPAEEEEEKGVLFLCPQKLLPLDIHTSDLLASERHKRIVNNDAFLHASSVLGFQPFVGFKDVLSHKECVTQEVVDLTTNSTASSVAASDDKENKEIQVVSSGFTDAQVVEREEGEWSDMDCDGSASEIDRSDVKKRMFRDNGETLQKQGWDERSSLCGYEKSYQSVPQDGDLIEYFKGAVVDSSTGENGNASLGLDSQPFEHSCSSSRNSDNTNNGDIPVDGLEESSTIKEKEVKGGEASHALRCANNFGKRHKLDEHKEAMLGKKRGRQTVFLNLEDVKQAGPIKTSRRQTFSSPIITHTVKEIRTIPLPAEHMVEKQGNHGTKDHKQADAVNAELSTHMQRGCCKVEVNGNMNSGVRPRTKTLNGGSDFSVEEYPPRIPKQGSWKLPTDSRQLKNQISTKKQGAQNRECVDTTSGDKNNLILRKQPANGLQYHDTSVERLIREVTSEKFWHHPGELDLQCVPGHFESVEEYVRVFEPLLFEECRAQLYSTWEESTETTSRDTHIMVRIKSVEKRERGWCDAIVLPMHECKWNFKEGDIAVLLTPRPGTAKFKRSNNIDASEDGLETEVAGQVAGTVRRYFPIDTRDPLGVILHFYVGDAYDYNSKINDDHILRKLLMKGIWSLTVLGSLATTQREYIALHGFHRLNLQMQTAILKPSPEHFPKYEEQPPAMPECFTQNFVDYLHRTFNRPQLSAIQWAAMHTAAGTNSSGVTKRQEPWPFTLVQGPPGTGKTHTVWGMLNVIHLVRYQHYYTALLKKLAPESYKQNNDSNLDSVNTGSIDDALQSMDENLFRTLPILCPKPRMLVCAPSNAATDELLARVLDRGFIDGEMKVYRPDVARVGVDSQTHAAQAVSVERRTEQLLFKSREEVVGWMHQLKAREAHFSQQIACLQRELNVAAAAGRSQGSVGVNPDVLVARDQNRDARLQNLAAVLEARDKVLVEMSRLLILESRFCAGSNFNLEEARSNLEASFANEAEIVFTTVSSSGRKLFSRLAHGFDMVVIDEAAQAGEVAVLPPLSLGASRCVLVGDPQQLPATVISKAAGTLSYSRSLFERFQQAGCPTMLLSVQYRMHPQIRDFPSRYFYKGCLTDSESVAKLADERYYSDPLLKPYVFYDIMHGRESHRGRSVSYQNIHEAKFCLRLYEHLQKTLNSYCGSKVSVGIITPYKLQLKCLQREFEDVLKSEERKGLYINTVDAFQGQERDVIIMSCVRASDHGVGFVADIRRMNVALTRARRALWVMGNANALMQSDDWAALISDAKARKCFVPMDSLPKDFLVPKANAYTSLPNKTYHMRGMMMSAWRNRHSSILP